MFSYFDEILQATPESVEDVIVEADGEWHTSDNKYHSTGWVPPKPSLTKPKAASKPIAPLPKRESPFYAANGNGSTSNGKRSYKDDEVYVFDSDDEADAAQVSRQVLSHSQTTSSSKGKDSAAQNKNKLVEEVIDLTLDSDEEDTLPHPTTAQLSGKRKERSPTATSIGTMPDYSKRSRLDSQSSRSDEGGGGGSSRGGYMPFQDGVRHTYDLPPLHNQSQQPYRDFVPNSLPPLNLPPLHLSNPQRTDRTPSFGTTPLRSPSFDARMSPSAMRPLQPPLPPPYGRRW